MSQNGKPKFAMYWAAACGGCEIAVLNIGEKILDVDANFDVAFWPVNGAEDMTAPATRLMFAIGGGLMVSWGLLMWMIVDRLYPREPHLARTLIITAVAVWFVVDSAASIAAGAPLNAVLNTGFVLLYGLALRRPAQTANA